MLENIGQSHHLNKLSYLGYCKTDFNQTFTERMAVWLATKMSQADLENVGQGQHLKKILIALLLYH